MNPHLKHNRSSRAITAIVSAALLAVAWIVYFSPAGLNKSKPESTTRVVYTTMPRSGWTPSVTPKRVTPTPKHVTVTTVRVQNPRPGATRTGDSSTVGGRSRPPVRATVPACTTFRWQQDAQTVYLVNLSDPNGLDGPVGANNGNGLACDTLPVDPSQGEVATGRRLRLARGEPADQGGRTRPGTKYFGLAADGLPGDSTCSTTRISSAAKAPDLVEWFQYFDESYPGGQGHRAWQRGALPVSPGCPRPGLRRPPICRRTR